MPRLSWARRQVLSVATPLILGTMAQMMMKPPSSLIHRFAIPPEVVAAAYGSEAHAQDTVVALRKVRRLARELGLVNSMVTPLWRVLGVWDDDA